METSLLIDPKVAVHVIACPTQRKLTVVLNAGEIFPDDPGRGTPALVVYDNGCSATLECALNEGELLADCPRYHKGPDFYHLSPAQMRWLESIYNECGQWLDVQSDLVARKGKA